MTATAVVTLKQKPLGRLGEDVAQRLQRVRPVVLAALDEGQPDFGEGVEAKEEIVKQMTAN